MTGLKDYISEVKKVIQEIQKRKLEDRMDSHAALSDLLVHFQASIMGWAKWVQDPRIMSKFSEDELKEFYNNMRKIAIEFLELDIYATNKMLKKKKEKKARKKGQRRKNYIA